MYLAEQIIHCTYECTKVQNHQRIIQTEIVCTHKMPHVRTCMNSNYEVYGRLLVKRWRLKRKKLAALHQVIFQVVFSLMLALLGRLEGSAVEKVRGMSLQYPHRLSQ